MRVAACAAALFGLLAAVHGIAGDIRPGDLLIAAQDGIVVVNGKSSSFVKKDYFVDLYDNAGIFRSRLLSGPPLQFLSQASGLLSADDAILFAEDRQTVRRISGDGPGDRFGGPFTWVSTMAVDGAGHVYVADHQERLRGEVLKHDRSGNVIARYPLDVWFAMDLDADGCTLVYAQFHSRLIGGDYLEEWLSVSRYDLCASRPLTDVIPRLDVMSIVQLRLLSDGGLLILTDSYVERRSSSGQPVWRHAHEQLSPFFLSLNVTGSQFWAATSGGWLSRYSVETGALLEGPLKMNSDRVPLAGTVIGEWRAARKGLRGPETPARETMP